MSEIISPAERRSHLIRITEELREAAIRHPYADAVLRQFVRNLADWIELDPLHVRRHDWLAHMKWSLDESVEKIFGAWLRAIGLLEGSEGVSAALCRNSGAVQTALTGAIELFDEEAWKGDLSESDRIYAESISLLKEIFLHYEGLPAASQTVIHRKGARNESDAIPIYEKLDMRSTKPHPDGLAVCQKCFQPSERYAARHTFQFGVLLGSRRDTDVARAADQLDVLVSSRMTLRHCQSDSEPVGNIENASFCSQHTLKRADGKRQANKGAGSGFTPEKREQMAVAISELRAIALNQGLVAPRLPYMKRMIAWYRIFPTIAKRKLTQHISRLREGDAVRLEVIQRLTKPLWELLGFPKALTGREVEIRIHPSGVVGVLYACGQTLELRPTDEHASGRITDALRDTLKLVRKLVPLQYGYDHARFPTIGLTVEVIETDVELPRITFVVECPDLLSRLSGLRCQNP